MTTVTAKIRDTKTTGDVNKIRLDGFIPGILYGGSKKNQKISLSKNLIKSLIDSENFLSNIIKKAQSRYLYKRLLRSF